MHFYVWCNETTNHKYMSCASTRRHSRRHSRTEVCRNAQVDGCRTLECALRGRILGGEKIPTDFEFICASFRRLGVLFEKKN